MKHTLIVIIVIVSIISYFLYEAWYYSEQNNLESIVTHAVLENPKTTEIFYMLAAKKIAESEKNVKIEDVIKQIQRELKTDSYKKKLTNLYSKRYNSVEIRHIRSLVENPLFDRYAEDSFEITKDALREVDTIVEKILNQINEAKRSNSKTVEITAENFEKEIQNSKEPVVLDFYADWCAPCKSIEVILEELSSDIQKPIKFTRLDITAQKEIAEKFKVKDLPLILFIKEGKIKDKHTGFGDKETLRKKIEDFLNT